MDSTSEFRELKDRVLARRKELEARLHQLRADSRNEARERRRQIEQRLRELEMTVRDGWNKLSSNAAGKLNEWLRKVDGDGA